MSTGLSEARRLQRGLVLHALQAQYPHPLTQVSLERQVAHLIQAGGELDQVMGYLVEKGLVKAQAEKIGRHSVTTYRLTADGVDVADGSVQLAGVDMGVG